MKQQLFKALFASRRAIAFAFWLTGFPMAAVGSEGFSFPGPTPTLIDLYTKAELVVHADVVKTESEVDRQLSRLKIVSVIKADKRKAAKEIEVCIRFGSHWPLPFDAKSRIITFLDFDKALNRYVPINSITCLNVDDEKEGIFYVKQFAKLPEILAESDQRKQLIDKVQWYVELILFPPSRTNGAFGFSVLWSRALKAKLLNFDERKSRADLWTRTQKDLICGTLVKETPDSSANRIVELLKDYPSRDLDLYLIRSLKRSMMFEKAVPVLANDIALSAVKYLPERLGFDVPKEWQMKLEDFKLRRKFYLNHLNNRKSKEYSETERAKVYDELIRLWRNLTTTFLAIPEVANVRK